MLMLYAYTTWFRRGTEEEQFPLQEIADLKTQLHSLLSQLVRKDALIEEKTAQVGCTDSISQ